MLDNLSSSLNSPGPRGGKQGLLLPSLFASSSDVLKKTIGRREGEERDPAQHAFKSVGVPRLESTGFLAHIWSWSDQQYCMAFIALQKGEMLQCHITSDPAHSCVEYQ